MLKNLYDKKSKKIYVRANICKLIHFYFLYIVYHKLSFSSAKAKKTFLNTAKKAGWNKPKEIPTTNPNQ